MKKMFSRTACAALAAALSLSVSTGVYAQGSNGEAKTPDSADNAALYWATKVGTSWTDGPSPVAIAGDSIIYTSADKLCRINKETGEKDSVQGQAAGTKSYAVTAPLYADGKIFVGFDGGIQAFDADTLESLWIYKDELGGQSLSSICYSDGCIYTGFWSSGWSESDTKNFVCIDVADEDPDKTDEKKSAKWTYAVKGGFYWTGAYVNGDFAVVGTEDGETGSAGSASVITFDKETGDVLDKAEDIYGDVRSGISYDEETDAYYFTSKGGKFYSVKINENGKFSDLKSLDLGGSSTSTPSVLNGRAYVGVSGTGWSAYNGCGIAVIDLESFKLAYKAETAGTPQVKGLAVVNEDGYNYVYFTENTTPGGIRYIKDKKGVDEVLDAQLEGDGEDKHICAPVLFTPTGDQANYAIAELAADEDGTIYYKNDSNYIMAVGSAVKEIKADTANVKTLYKEGEVFDTNGVKVTAVLANGVEKDITDKVVFSEEKLTADDSFVTVTYSYGLYKDKTNDGAANTAGVKVSPVDTVIDVNVLIEGDYDKVQAVIKAISELGGITLDSEKVVTEARAAYDQLGDLKEYVSNYDVLLSAEKAIEELKNPEYSQTSSETVSSKTGTESTADNSSNVESKAVTSSKSANSAASSNPATGTAGGLCFAGVAVVICGAVVSSKKKNK